MKLGFLAIIAVAFLGLEIVAIALMTATIGGLATLAWLLADLFIGGWLIRRTWAGVVPELTLAMQRGQDPVATVWRSGRRFLAGLLLIFPGFVTDAVALILLLGAGLPRARAADAPGPATPGGAPGAGMRPGAARGEVIEGEYRRED